MKLDIMEMCLDDIEDLDLSEIKPNKKDLVRYKNNIIPSKSPGVPSNVSIEATAIMLASFGDFPIPPEITAYIKDAYDNGRVNDNKIPSNEDLYEKGKNILMAFIEKGIPYYSACAMTGACYVECGWNVNVYNKLEKERNGVGGTGGWSGCGEGLFGLTFWSQKYKVMSKLMLPQMDVNTTQHQYDTRDYPHLCDCNESQWVDILEAYLDVCVPKHKEILYSTDIPEDDEARTKILCSGYLFKAAGGLESTFDNVKDTTARYMRTHTMQGGEGYHAYDGFALQIFISIFLDRYLHGAGVDLEGKSLIDVAFSSMGDAPLSSEVFGNIVPSNENFKKNSRYFDKGAACKYLKDHATISSNHICGKAVRQAIEAGGISTNGRPELAWKYINFLPTIGFKYIFSVPKGATWYAPQRGDIAVYLKNGNPNAPGHICMWSGSHWISDFKQGSMIVYSETKEAHIYRFDG